MAAMFDRVSEILESITALGTHVALQGCALLFLASLLTFLLRHRISASCRHTLWVTTLAALLALPLLARSLPTWRLPLSRPVTQTVATPLTGPTTPPRNDTEADLASALRPGAFAAVASEASSEVQPPMDANSAVPTLQFELPLPLPILLWLAGVLLLGGWFALAHGSARWLALQAQEWPQDAIRARVHRLTAEVGLRRDVRLLESGEHNMPMTWGWLRPILLLPSTARSWPEERLRHVVLHELAHVRRGDAWTRLLAQAACTLHWFNPFAWYAARRLTLESEHACDDDVLQAGVRASDYAEDLLAVARSLRPRALRGAIAMAGRSSLRERLVAVLDSRRPRGRRGSRALAASLLLVAGFALPLASFSWTAEPGVAASDTQSMPPADAASPSAFIEPGAEPAASRRPASTPTVEPVAPPSPSAAPSPHAPPLPPAPPAPPEPPAWTFDEDPEEHRIRGTWEVHTDDGTKLHLKARGDIEFDAQGTDIVHVSEDGSFDLRFEEGKERYRIRIEGAENGAMERRYWVDGKERPYEAEAQQRLAALLPLLFRETGFMAGPWVQRTLDAEGVDGVLRQVEEIDSDFVTRKILLELERRADLNPAQLSQVFELASRKMTSDFELASLLGASAKTQRFDRAAHVAYARAAASIDSDFERARALSLLLQTQPLDDDAFAAVLECAADIDSDFELARVLLTALEEQTVNEHTLPHLLAALEQVDSDFELRRVAQHTAAQRRLNAVGMTELVALAGREIDSDFELAQFLVQVAQSYDVQGPLRQAYLDAADRIDSTHESQRVLSALSGR